MKITQSILIGLITTSVLLMTGCDKSIGSDGSNVSSTSYTITIPAHTNSSIYSNYTNGPRFSAVEVTNTGTNTNLTLTAAPQLDTSNPVAIVAASDTNVYNSLTACANGTILSPNQSCYIFLHADQSSGLPFSGAGAVPQQLTITTSAGTSQVDIDSVGYLYLAGDFNTLGDATIGTLFSNFLLAKCSFVSGINQLSCTNALNGVVNPYANNSIFTLGVDGPGNIYAGGLFTQLGTATASTGLLLAKFNPSTDQTTNAFSNVDNPLSSTTSGEIDAITFDDDNNAYITGVLTQAGGINVNPTTFGQNLLAKCNLTTGNTCTSNILDSNTQNYVGGNPINTLSMYSNTYLIAGGQMDTLGDSSTANSGSCNATNGTCNQLISAGTIPNNIVYSSAITGNTLLTAGYFTQIGALNVPGPTPSANYSFIAQCTLNPSTGQVSGCTNNALGTGNANTYFTGGVGLTDTAVRGIVLDNNNRMFIAGKFDTIATNNIPSLASTSGTNLIARCPISGTSCQDLLVGSATDGANNTVNTMVKNIEITAVSVALPHPQHP